jgi:hypothetical protein
VDVAACHAERGRRPLLRFCLDWTEQRHHLAGRLGGALAEAMRAQQWIAQVEGRRRAGRRRRASRRSSAADERRPGEQVASSTAMIV